MICDTQEPPVAIIAPVLEPTAKELVESRLKSEAWAAIDQLEEEASKLEQVDLPVSHVFTPGLYTRSIYMPAGVKLTSRIHLLEHPFLISKGIVSVWDGETGWVKLTAPYMGITKPGTRRVLLIHEDTIWTTFHVTNETDPDKIGMQITYTGGKHASLGNAASKKQLT